jgi:serine/threonine protein kinase
MRKEGSGRDSSMTRALCRRVYCAPELLMGKVHYGTEVDIWSLGVVAAELIGGDVCPPIQRARASSATPPHPVSTALPQHPNTAPLAHMCTSVYERGWYTAHIRWGRQPDIACFDLLHTWPSIYSRAPGPSPLRLPPMRVQSRHPNIRAVTRLPQATFGRSAVGP